MAKILIDPTEYRAFLKRYIKDFYEIDAPMIAGAVERCLLKLETQPTVEVVRCKGCYFSKYFEESGTRICRAQKGLCRTVEDDEFCSYGERRDDGT